jgi:transcriptional regulator with XRE-family HTH domain
MNRIKQLREENNITQIQLAKKLNKTQQTISLYENGTNEPDLDSYIILAQIFNCSIEYIAGKSDIKNIGNEYKFAYHKEEDGLSQEEIEEALKLYKQIKYGDLGKKKEK